MNKRTTRRLVQLGCAAVNAIIALIGLFGFLATGSIRFLALLIVGLVFMVVSYGLYWMEASE